MAIQKHFMVLNLMKTNRKATFSKENLNFIGVSHMDEKLYFFPVREDVFPNSLPTKEDEEMRKSLVQMWVDFARTG